MFYTGLRAVFNKHSCEDSVLLGYEAVESFIKSYKTFISFITPSSGRIQIEADDIQYVSYLDSNSA